MFIIADRTIMTVAIYVRYNLKRASLPSIEFICSRCNCAGLATSQGWKTYTCPNQSPSAGSTKSDHGAPRKRYKDQLKRQLAQVGISRQTWQQEASDRDSWRSSVRKASCKSEAERHEAAKEKRRRQKEQAASLPSSTQTFICPKCSMLSASRISLYSHHRVCKNWPSIFPKIFVC